MSNIDKEEQFLEIFYRFCSIHNELGDRFTIGKGDEKEDIDLIEHYFPFNVNIACIGRFRQGKSTGVNVILKEYKAKESDLGISQTEYLTFYQASNHPIRVLDIPGFEDEQTVKAAVEKFKQCGEKINKIKDNLHVVLYFLKLDNSIFLKFEYPMWEELIKHKNTKLIYVIIHSNEDKDQRNDFIKKINNRLKQIVFQKKKEESKKKQLILSSFHSVHNRNTLNISEAYPLCNINENEETEIITDEADESEEEQEYDYDLIYQKIKAENDNSVFVNFHSNHSNQYRVFGKEDLFKKIKEAFINSEDYKTFSEKIDEKSLKEKIEGFKKKALDIVLSNKIRGAIVGIVPGVDYLFQKYLIKKNASKKDWEYSWN